MKIKITTSIPVDDGEEGGNGAGVYPSLSLHKYLLNVVVASVKTGTRTVVLHEIET